MLFYNVELITKPYRMARKIDGGVFKSKWVPDFNFWDYIKIIWFEYVTNIDSVKLSLNDYMSHDSII